MKDVPHCCSTHCSPSARTVNMRGALLGACLSFSAARVHKKKKNSFVLLQSVLWRYRSLWMRLYLVVTPRLSAERRGVTHTQSLNTSWHSPASPVACWWGLSLPHLSLLPAQGDQQLWRASNWRIRQEKKFRDFYFCDKVTIFDHIPYNFPHVNGDL